MDEPHVYVHYTPAVVYMLTLLISLYIQASATTVYISKISHVYDELSAYCFTYALKQLNHTDITIADIILNTCCIYKQE